jgi:hypothetical protein
MSGDRFCDYCGVDLSLHFDDEPSDENCNLALRKVEVMDRFWEPFRPIVQREEELSAVDD